MGRWDDKFEKAERRWNERSMQEYPLTERTLPQILEDKARQRPNHVAFHFRDCTITLGQLVDRLHRIAAGLHRLGIRKGDKVAIMLPNCPEFIYAWFALSKIGAVEVPINVALKGDGLRYQIAQSDSKVLIASTRFLDRLAAVAEDISSLEDIVWVTDEDAVATGGEFSGIGELAFAEIASERAECPEINVRHDDLASILYTSGTTGRSKGVMLSHHYWYEIWAQSVKYSRYTDHDVLYSGLPLFHGNAQGITVGSSLLADAQAVIVERFSASKFWDDCRRWECTEANYIGGMIPILMKQGPKPDDPDNPVRLMVGAAASEELWDAFQRRFNTKLLEVYGMTECYCCLVSPYETPRAGSCGKPDTGWDVRIMDENDHECSPREVGEIVVRTEKEGVGTTGYYNNPEATSALMGNGWMHTGDLGYRDEDGYFYFVDRKKQAIRRRGENISSFEVEAIILSNPAVLECCVVGVPAEMGEEEVKAVVVPNSGHSLTEEEIIRWCESRLAYFAIPRYVAIRDRLPKTPSERVEKYKIKAEGVTRDCWDRESAGISLQR